MAVRLKVMASPGGSSLDDVDDTAEPAATSEFSHGSRILGGRIADKVGSRLGFNISPQPIPKPRRPPQALEVDLLARPAGRGGSSAKD